MIIQGKGGTPPAGPDLEAAKVQRLVGWSLRKVLQRCHVPCRTEPSGRKR
jgi:hypothetical protein